MAQDRIISPVLIDRVADFGATLEYAQIPQTVIDHTKRFLADTCAVSIAGRASPSTSGILKSAALWDGDAPGPARCVGEPNLRLSPGNAAFVNGYKAHCLEWDSLHEEAVSIGFCTPVAAMLAECEVRDVSGEDFLAALIAAVEFFTVLCLASGSSATFFRPSAGGTISAALGVARIRRYTPEQTRQTLGLAFSLAGGTMQAHWEGSATLAMQVGAGARSAIHAADMAASGIAAPVDIFTGKFGFYTIVERAGTFAERSKDLGTVWRIPEIAYKPFPCGRATHGVLTILKDLKAAGKLDPNAIEKVVVTAPPLISVLVDRPVLPEMQPGYARLCLPFVFVMFAYHGDIDPRAFTDPVRPTERGIALARKLEMKVIEGAPTNTLSPITVDIEFTDGTTHNADCSAPWGAPKNSFTDNDLLAKIAKCIDCGEMETVPEAFLDTFLKIETADNIRLAVDHLYI